MDVYQKTFQTQYNTETDEGKESYLSEQEPPDDDDDTVAM